MKRILKGLFLGILVIGLTCSCFKRDNMENIKIYTTVYPITYIINQLYGNYATIQSIYPNGIDAENYELTDKQITDYSTADLFIYNGLSNEKEIARKLINKNKELKIIDVSYGLSIEYGDSANELWLSPNNYLMLATTVKDSLKDFMTSTYMKEEIENNYKVIQEEVSLIDAELRSIGSTSASKNKNTIITATNSLKYLENYGFNVISIVDDKNYTTELKNNFKNNVYKYIFIEKEDEKVKELVDNYGAETIKVNTMTTLTDQEVENKEDYINITKTFIQNLSNVVL